MFSSPTATFRVAATGGSGPMSISMSCTCTGSHSSTSICFKGIVAPSMLAQSESSPSTVMVAVAASTTMSEISTCPASVVGGTAGAVVGAVVASGLGVGSCSSSPPQAAVSSVRPARTLATRKNILFILASFRSSVNMWPWAPRQLRLLHVVLLLCLRFQKGDELLQIGVGEHTGVKRRHCLGPLSGFLRDLLGVRFAEVLAHGGPLALQAVTTGTSVAEEQGAPVLSGVAGAGQGGVRQREPIVGEILA